MTSTLSTYRNRALLIALTATAVIGCGTSAHRSSAPPTSVVEQTTTTTIPPPSDPAPSSEEPTPPTDATEATTDWTPPATIDDAFRVELQTELDATVAAGVPGAVLLSRVGDKTVTVAAGVSDIATGAPMTNDTKFRTGSVAKTFTATVVLQLVDEGLLSLDDTIEKWLPALVPNGDAITVRDLLGNRSGLFDFIEDPQVLQPYLAGDLSHVWTSADLVAVSTQHPQNFAPGTGTLYSNTDYTVMGMIVETATGQSVSDLIRTRITEPLHLASTSMPTDESMGSGYSHGYFVGETLSDVTSLDPSVSSFGGNLVSTAEDLATFYDALFAGRLFSAEQMTAMLTTTTSTTGEHLGLGLQVVDIPCGTFTGHTGSTPGYKAGAMVDLANGNEFVFLANSITLDDSVGSPEAAAALDAAVTTAACGPTQNG